MAKLGLAVWILMWCVGTGQAEGYRLTQGDRLLVSYDFITTPKSTVIDLDGNIRLSGLGSLPVRNQTLDEVEAAITGAMIEGGFSGIPTVSVEITEYAPIVVSGFVTRGGRYEYLPGMNVAAAVAVAGGLGRADLSPSNAAVLNINATRRAAEAGQRIAVAVADILRFEAALDPHGQAIIEGASGLLDLIPPGQQASMGERLELERRQLAGERAVAAELVASWQREIADFEAQITLLDQRIALKEETVAALSQELADVDVLRAQGLATTTRFSALQQRLADDREDLLSLETAKVAARRAAGTAARTMAQFLGAQRAERMRGLEAARDALTESRESYQLAQGEAALLGDEPGLQGAADTGLAIHYTLSGSRADRLKGAEITVTTPLLPGDILQVQIMDTP